MGKIFIYKAPCCVRGDRQVEYVDFDPNGTYASVASHKAFHILFGYAAFQNLFVKGGDVASAYLYGKIYFEVYSQQQTNASGRESLPGHVCLLHKSMYGIIQAGRI